MSGVYYGFTMMFFNLFVNDDVYVVTGESYIQSYWRNSQKSMEHIECILRDLEE